MKLNSQIVAKQHRDALYMQNPNTCKNCNSSLTYDKRHLKYCNHSCAASYTNRSKIKHGRYSEKECVICKTTTVNPKYCSKSCMAIGQTKYSTPEDGLMIKRARSRESFARYSARKKYQTPIDENLSAIKEFYKNCPKGFEVDHIIPISKGGPHSLSNLQYLSSTDNKRKSAKLNWCPQDDSNA